MSDRDPVKDVDSIAALTRGGATRRSAIPAGCTDLLEKRSFAHLASLGPDGAPQSHPVWFEVVDGDVLVSTGTDRQKYRNIRRDPRVSVSVLDPDDPYRYLEVRGRVVAVERDPGTAFLDRLAHRYLGVDTYPYPERRDVERVVVRIRPEHVVGG